MTWETIVDYMRWVWILFAVPVIQWGNKKRKEYSSLVKKVEGLEHKMKTIDTKIDEDRAVHKATSNKIDKIYDLLKDTEKETAINSARLEERKDQHY